MLVAVAANATVDLLANTVPLAGEVTVTTGGTSCTMVNATGVESTVCPFAAKAWAVMVKLFGFTPTHWYL